MCLCDSKHIGNDSFSECNTLVDEEDFFNIFFGEVETLLGFGSNFSAFLEDLKNFSKNVKNSDNEISCFKPSPILSKI